jgi:hypothetical protein
MCHRQERLGLVCIALLFSLIAITLLIFKHATSEICLQSDLINCLQRPAREKFIGYKIRVPFFFAVQYLLKKNYFP